MCEAPQPPFLLHCIVFNLFYLQEFVMLRSVVFLFPKGFEVVLRLTSDKNFFNIHDVYILKYRGLLCMVDVK